MCSPVACDAHGFSHVGLHHTIVLIAPFLIINTSYILLFLYIKKSMKSTRRQLGKFSDYCIQYCILMLCGNTTLKEQTEK